jgi:hypothetical protein
MAKPFADVTPNSDPIRVRAALLSAITAYDQRQARGKFYNPYALPQYADALTRAMAAFNGGLDRALEPDAAMRSALVSCFTGRLLDVVLKAVNLPKSTDREQRF